ncbi:MAG: ABC transporter ATP-binding protein [Pseudomonadota bacterium]
MTELVANKLRVVVDDAMLLDDASLTVRAGEVVAILGPNGAGKTTLLRALLGLVATESGSSQLDGSDVTSFKADERARQIAYLPQRRPLAWPNRVRDVIALGRFAHGAALGRLGEKDQAAVERAITACDLESLAERSADSLSGGELARVHFARAFATEAPLLIADEPVAALDPRHQLRVANLIRQFVDNGGGTLVVLHEVSMAARIADRLVWMKEGRIVADGTPQETLTADRIADVYGIDVQVSHDDIGFDIRLLGTS